MNKLSLAVLLVSLAPCASAQPPPPSAPGDAAAWSLDALRAARAEQRDPWHAFLRVPAASAGLYVLAAGADDDQSPHERDELYHVISGRAVLVAGEQRYPAGPGSVFFVKARVPHRFVEIQEQLEVLVFFGGADPQPPPE